MKNVQFGREKYGLLFYIKIKSCSALVKSSHGEKLPEKWPENYRLKKSSSGAFPNA